MLLFILFMQNGKAVVGTPGALFEEVKCDDDSVILLLSGTKKALYVKDTSANTPITAVLKDDHNNDNNHKWILKPQDTALTVEETSI